MFEAEINMVIHAHGGQAHIDIGDDKITIVMEDHGPGIPDIELAMQPGYSTASESARDLGWGAGMGLPNMKRNSDFMKIDSKVGEGTKVTMEIKIKNV
jgi:anti-sigma regulatory factor (Ser/Thr protein kinase)